MPNVSSVVNELTVGPLNTFTERSKDTYVTTKVKASLVDAKDLFANSIKVTTHRGVVYLMGRVTEREANRASEVARGVSGVVKVVRVFEVISRGGAGDNPAQDPGAGRSRRQRGGRPAVAAQSRRLIRLEVSARLPPWACRSA